MDFAEEFNFSIDDFNFEVEDKIPASTGGVKPYYGDRNSLELRDWLDLDPQILEVFKNSYVEPNQYQVLEQTRFPGFSYQSISQQLHYLADALMKFPHVDTLNLFTLFALIHHNRGHEVKSP